MAETAATTTDETTTTTSETTPTDKTFTQADLDRIVGDRLAREKAKFADYETLKERAQKADELERAQLSETERLQRERDEATTAGEAAQAAAAATLLEAQRTLVAAKAGLPDELGALLQGNTKEELEAHAETLKAFAKPAEEPDPTEDDGFGGGTRRQQPKGMTKAQVAKLARENPTKFNEMLEKGELSLSDLQ